MNGHTSWDVRLAISFQSLDDFLQSIWLDFQTFIHIQFFYYFPQMLKYLQVLRVQKKKKKKKLKECKKKNAKDSRN
jgi:hypothetical protein